MGEGGGGLADPCKACVPPPSNIWCNSLAHLKWTKLTKFIKARSRGLVFKAEDSWLRGPGINPPLWRPFFKHHSFGSKLGTWNWHCCMCCNPPNGRVDFEEWSAYKILLHGTEWIVSLSADWDIKFQFETPRAGFPNLWYAKRLQKTPESQK
jgi:hypothetical protein